jgi:hypothetical protein
MENPVERKLADAEAKAERTADDLVDVVFPWIRMAIADESDSHFSGYVERLRAAARRAIDYYEQKGEAIPAHVLAAYRSPFSKPSEQDDKKFDLGPGAIRLNDVDCREVVRCKSCDWVQFRKASDECARCKVSFADEPAKSGDSPAIDSSDFDESLQSGPDLIEPAFDISPEVLDVMTRKNTLR